MFIDMFLYLLHVKLKSLIISDLHVTATAQSDIILCLYKISPRSCDVFSNMTFILDSRTLFTAQVQHFSYILQLIVPDPNLKIDYNTIGFTH